jgi:hypothetical protein
MQNVEHALALVGAYFLTVFAWKLCREAISDWRNRAARNEPAAMPPSACITREEALSMLSETGQQIMRDLDVGEVLTGRSVFRFEKSGQWVRVSIEIEAPE